MGGKNSSKIISEWSSQHVHHQESRRPRRGKEPSAGSSVTMSSFDSLSNAYVLGSSSTYESDSLYDQQSKSKASSTENMSATISFESLPSSRTTLLGSRSNAPSSMTTTTDWFSHSTIPSSRAITNTSFDSRSRSFESRTTSDWISHSATTSSRTAANTFGFGSSGSNSMTPPAWLSGYAIPSFGTNAYGSRSSASNSTVTEDLFSHWMFQHVSSTSNPSSSVDTFSPRASMAHDDGAVANQQLKPPKWLQISNHPTNNLDHPNIKFELQKQWSPIYFSPPPMVVKINCAVSFEASSQQAGFGAVIRTQQGIFLAAVSGKLASCDQPTLGEIHAIKEGLRLAAWMNLQDVEVMSDSPFLILELQKPIHSLNFPYIHLINGLKGMAASFRNCKFFHVKQEANSVAHWLALYGCFLVTMQFWFYTAPTFILHAL